MRGEFQVVCLLSWFVTSAESWPRTNGKSRPDAIFISRARKCICKAWAQVLKYLSSLLIMEPARHDQVLWTMMLLSSQSGCGGSPTCSCSPVSPWALGWILVFYLIHSPIGIITSIPKLLTLIYGIACLFFFLELVQWCTYSTWSRVISTKGFLRTWQSSSSCR